jgi:hypothetical protein
MPTPFSFAANCAADLVAIVGDERVGHAAFAPGAKRLNRTRDRIVVSIGHAIKVRDDAANRAVRTGITLLQF